VALLIMAILVADSGSTKCSWRLVEGDSVKSFNSLGINPVFRSESQCIEIIEACFSGENRDHVKEIYFYGAGCSNDERKSKITKALGRVFKRAKIMVDHDILASCRALCGNEPGMAAILGTGTNTCTYDGSNIVANVPAMGYILGDEGSGSYMGKRLLSDYFRGLIPEEVKLKLEGEYDLDKDVVIERVYSAEAPNRYLASFSMFVHQNKQHPYCLNLIKSGFEDFFKYHVSRYKDYTHYKLNVLGSVAFYNRDILESVAKAYKVSLGKIIQEPIASLTLYHAPHLDS
jgi:N-acetylglucosamine kinase-like BadF-type ATPase